jgi:probable HAF family extracellular repeat protein
MWRQYRATDLGTLGGPNSAIEYYSHGTGGQFVGWSEISKTDPYAENFCGFGTSHICRGFSWRLGKMTSLPTLGGNNAQADDVNNRGQIVGAAETSTKDASCPAPQVYDFYGVIWQPNGKITSLTPYSRDTVSLASAVNRTGAVVGSSGPCTNLFTHAVLWNLGSTIKLGSLGGSEAWAQDINNRGQITGTSLVSGNKAFHAFLWQNGTMTDLGALRGYPSSYALGINDRGQIVGESCTASALCHGFLWQNGTMTDLNTLIPPKTKLYIFSGNDINNSGQIAAIAVNTERHARAVVLVPGRKADGPSSVLAPKITVPEKLPMQLPNLRAAHFGHFPHLTI